MAMSPTVRHSAQQVVLASVLLLTIPFPIWAQQSSLDSGQEMINRLQEAIRQQQDQIEQLRLVVQKQGDLLESLRYSVALGPARTTPAMEATVAPTVISLATATVVVQERTETTSPRAAAVTEETKRVDDLAKSLGGFRFSGDFRFRLDAQLRSGNAVAGPLQNIRSRYRLRLNVEKELDRRFRVHVQLSTGPYQNGITNDQDMAGIVAKHPFSIAEAYVDFRPVSIISLRGGRMPEVFADNMRFLWDDDVRFNGFQQSAEIPLRYSVLGVQRIEFRAGEYVLTNPNVVILSPNSPFVNAGFQPGKKVRDATLFHPGFVLYGNPRSGWEHQIAGDMQIYRNTSQIQFASTAEGFPLLVNNALGLALAGPTTGVGNGTTSPGGTSFTARNFWIIHLAYRLQPRGLHLFGREIPTWLDFQVSRNVGAGKLRDALMASANLGAVKGTGNLRFLYQFAIKDANALISQFTDDDLGTGSGVNIAVHALRLDVGLTSFLQWQNLLFIQTERRASNPAEQFFVPLQRGANLTYRYLGQLAVSF